MYTISGKKLSIFMCGVAALLVIMTGCSTTEIPVKVKVPGEFNLTGVSKIAMVDFNSLPKDPVVGVYSVDKETVSVVQRMVSSAFSESKMYQVANLDIEKDIVEKHSTRLANRFDAVLYGRLWWQVTPEYRNTYPKKYNLEKWLNIKYDTGKKNVITGEPIYQVAHVTTRRRDVLEKQFYRAWNANLMLSLTLYKLNKDGKFDKITDMYAVASQNYTLDNGHFYSDFVSIDTSAAQQEKLEERRSEMKAAYDNSKKNYTGKYEVVHKLATIPTELQAKLMLSNQLSKELSKKISPYEKVFMVPCEFDDPKLSNLLTDGAFQGAKHYIVSKVRSELGNAVADRMDPISCYDKSKFISVAEDPDPEDIDDDMMEDVVTDYREYLYALGVCEEATGQYEQALYTYRYAFNYLPGPEYALGISRCLFALGANDRVSEKARLKKSAARKSSLK